MVICRLPVPLIGKVAMPSRQIPYCGDFFGQEMPVSVNDES